EQQTQNLAFVVRRSADHKVARSVAPGLAKPVDISLESAGSGDQRLGLHLNNISIHNDGRTLEHAVLNAQTCNLCVIDHRNAPPRSLRIVGVNKRLAAAQEKNIGAVQVESAFKG